MPSVAISAVTGEGVEDLLRTLGDRLRALTTVVELSIPYERGDVLAAVHREGEVLVEQATRTTACGCAPVSTRRRRAAWREFVVPTVAPEWLRATVVRMGAGPGFVPPPYPYDRLDELKPKADAHAGGAVDLSIGTPCDPPPGGRGRGAGRVRHRAGLPGVGRLARVPGGAPPGGCRAGSASTSTPSTWRRAWAPRSSSPACRSGCTCGRPAGTPCSTRPCQLPDLRHGRHPGRVPGSRRAVRRALAGRPGGDRS